MCDRLLIQVFAFQSELRRLLSRLGRSRFLNIGAQIENYDELEQMLRQIRPFGDGLQKPLLEKYNKLAGFGTVVLFLPVFLSNDRTVVTPCAVLLLGLLGWSFVETLRNRNIDARTKRSMYMVVFPVFGVLAKLAFIWL